MAARQHGVISRQQLYACGLSYDEVRGWVERGHLHPLHRGVFSVGHDRTPVRGRLIAAQLLGGPAAWLSHRTAAALAGLRTMNPWQIELTVPATRATTAPSGLVFHRSRRPPHADEVIRTPDGLRTSSVPRLLIELAATEPRHELDRLLELSLRKGLLHIDRLERAIERHARRPGIARLKAAAADYLPQPFDKSGLERSVAQAIARDPRIPPPQRNVKLTAGGISWEIDFWWERERVALEADGHQYHLTPDDLERDRLKDAKLQAIGITPLRVTDRRWELDAEGALGDLRAILQRRPS